jgi:tetratricopeptide (TPR) repeat protein
MLAKDISPDRLTRAKLFMNRLVEVLKDDRIGIILFAGRAYLQMPLSTDHSAASMYIQQASPESVPTQGTVLSEALRLSASAFVSKERKYKSIIVITDGEDHDPAAIPVAQELLSNGIMINTIGIGSPEGTTIIDPETGTAKTDPEGNIVVSKLNESILQQLASSTNGIYLRLDNPEEAIRSLVQQLGTIEKTAMADSEFRTFKSYYQYFVGLALILLIIEFLLSERRRTGNARNEEKGTKFGARVGPGATVLSLLLLFCFFQGNAQTVNQSIYKANQLYRKGEFQKAIEAYRKAQQKDPENAVIQYNLANALYRTNQFAEAERLYTEAIEKKGKQAGDPGGEPGPTEMRTELNRLYYNNGLAQTKQKKLEESIASYKQALIHDPNDADARFNLQKALSERKPPPQEQQSKKEQQKKKERQQQNKSKLNKKQVENLLKALQQREQEAQRKMQQNRTRASAQPEKDW